MSPTAPPLPALPDPARIDVVVPARAAGDTLPRALRSVLAQRPPVDRVVVACDPGDTGTIAAVEEARRDEPRLARVDAPGGRTPDALNAAIRACDGDVIVRVDAHAVLPDGYVARAVDTLRRTSAANVGGRQVPTADEGFAAAVAAAMRSPFGSGGATYRGGTAEGPADTVYLGVFRRAAFEAVGAYDPRMTRNQDAELNLRLTRAGYTVWFDPTLAVAYRPRGRIRTLASQYHGYGRWRRVTARLHPGSLRARQLAPPLLVAALVVLSLAAVIVGRPVVLLAPLTAYVLALLAAGLAAAPRPSLAPATAVALGTMHLAWGLGFLLGPPRAPEPPPDPIADQP